LQRHPGDKAFFFLAGKGHTLVDGRAPRLGRGGFIDPADPARRRDVPAFQRRSVRPAFLFRLRAQLASPSTSTAAAASKRLEDAPEYGDAAAREKIAASPPVF
jgi:hypothetical protein